MGLPVIFAPVGGGGRLYFLTAVSITPSLGAELLANADFSAWTGDNPDSWSVTLESGSDPEVTERDSGQLHAGTNAVGGSANFYSSGNDYAPRLSQGLSHLAGRFYQFAVAMSARASGVIAILTGQGAYRGSVTLTASGTATVRGVGNKLTLITLSAPSDFTVDSLSYKLISDTDQLFSQPSRFYGDWTINYSRTADYQAGVYACRVDANNWLLLYEDGDGKATLIKNVAGVVTAIGSYSITYAADKDLTLRVHLDGTLDVLYNGATLASGIADTGLRGTGGGAMLTDSSNVTINSFAWDARSAT